MPAKHAFQTVRASASTSTRNGSAPTAHPASKTAVAARATWWAGSSGVRKNDLSKPWRRCGGGFDDESEAKSLALASAGRMLHRGVAVPTGCTVARTDDQLNRSERAA